MLYLTVKQVGDNICLTDFYSEIENKYITLKELTYLKNKYGKVYRSLKKRKKFWGGQVKDIEKEFLCDFKNIDKFIEKHNDEVITKQRQNIEILDNINGYPLDDYQSKVVLSDEEASLVIAGAGSGKSLTIIGKIVYLVKVKKVKPEQILCISLTNDATINLKKNIAKNYDFNINIYTFHKLALEILKQQKIEFQIAPDNFLEETINDFFENTVPNNPNYQEALVKILGPEYIAKELGNLKRLIATFIHLFKANNYDIDYFLVILKKIKWTYKVNEYIRNKNILLFIINIYTIYQEELRKEKALDFNDMINKGIEVLKQFGLKKKWLYIIVDEYQDTSLIKFRMIEEIIKITHAKFLAVGDDFQSIYRFTGCDLHIFLKFKEYFKYAKIFQIVNTYRNPQELIDVAGDFVMKNKAQQRKKLKSVKHLDKPIVIYYKEDKVQALKDILLFLNKNSCHEIMVLGRNNRDIQKYIDKEFSNKESIYTYKNKEDLEISFRYLTMHKSKGLESENVILINVMDSMVGMPTHLKSEQLLQYVNNTKDFYPYEEERRLFYVALTRTKNRTYIISPLKRESIFVKEIVDNKNVKVLKNINLK